MSILSKARSVGLLVVLSAIVGSFVAPVRADVFFRGTLHSFGIGLDVGTGVGPGGQGETNADADPLFGDVVSLSFHLVEYAVPGSTVASTPAPFSAPAGRHSVFFTGGTARICAKSDCSDLADGQGWASSLSASEGDWIQIRTTAPSTVGSSRTATATAGSLLTRFLVQT